VLHKHASSWIVGKPEVIRIGIYGKEEATKELKASLMMKADLQQVPHVQSQEHGTSDSFVFFGATGDLAYKQIFPALQQMILRDNFNVPIIGVAWPGQKGEISFAALSQTVNTKSILGASGFANSSQLSANENGSTDNRV
jgi:hypothetical protein